MENEGKWPNFDFSPSFFELWSWITHWPYAIETSYLLPPLIFICWTSSCEGKLSKPLLSGYSRMAQKRLCAYLIIQLSLEADKIETSAWSQSILLLILHILVPSFTFLLQSKAKLLFLVKAENTGKKGVAILGTFFTSVGVKNFFGVSRTP